MGAGHSIGKPDNLPNADAGSMCWDVLASGQIRVETEPSREGDVVGRVRQARQASAAEESRVGGRVTKKQGKDLSPPPRQDQME